MLNTRYHPFGANFDDFRQNSEKTSYKLAFGVKVLVYFLSPGYLYKRPTAATVDSAKSGFEDQIGPEKIISMWP